MVKTGRFTTKCKGDRVMALKRQISLWWKIWKSYSIPISTKIRLMKALVWPVATYGCESWTFRKNEKIRLDAFEMKGLRKILWFSWTAEKTNKWVLNKAGVKRELLDTVKARKLAHYGHTTRKEGSCLEKDIMQGTMPCLIGWLRDGAQRQNVCLWPANFSCPALHL